MIAARFEMPESKIEERKAVLMKLIEIDGLVVDLTENRAQ